MPNKRIAQRRLVGYRAHLKLSGEEKPIECVVRDISHTGARIIVTSRPDLPETFSLLLSQNVTRECRVVWRKEKQLGVHFGDRKIVRERDWT